MKVYILTIVASRQDEEIRPKNHAAIALLCSWLEEDPGNQHEEWERVKEVLEENRLSDRSLFP